MDHHLLPIGVHRLASACAAALVLTALSFSVHGASACWIESPDSEASHPESDVDEAVLQRPAALEHGTDCLTSGSALPGQAALDEYLVVDTREAGDFHSARVSGSLNIPLRGVARSPFVLERPLILVGNDAQRAELLGLCASLRKRSEHPILVLDNALQGWPRRGDVVGDRPARADLPKLAPSEFLRSEQYYSWVVVGLGNAGDLDDEGFITHRVQTLGSLKSLLRGLRTTRKADTRNSRLLIVDQRGTSHAAVVRELQGASLEGVRYLSGGFQAYREVKDINQAVVNRQPNTSPRRARCRTVE